jgi:hypothetical protein
MCHKAPISDVKKSSQRFLSSSSAVTAVMTIDGTERSTWKIEDDVREAKNLSARRRRQRVNDKLISTRRMLGEVSSPIFGFFFISWRLLLLPPQPTAPTYTSRIFPLTI